MDEIELFRGEEFDADKIPDQFDLYEAMDRSSLIMNQLETALYNHPGLDEEQAKMAHDAFQLLFDIYQRAGSRFFDTQEQEEE